LLRLSETKANHKKLADAATPSVGSWHGLGLHRLQFAA
jgi:hypothetical protein